MVDRVDADGEAMPHDRVVCVLQGDDLGGDTWWFHWWLDEPEATPAIRLVSWGDELGPLLDALDRALPTPLAGETQDAAIRRALAGALCDPAREREMMAELGRALIGEELEAAIRSRRDRGCAVEIRVLAAHTCVRVPWALLIVPSGNARLCELTTVIDDVPASFHVGRARVAEEIIDGPQVRIVDPVVRGGGRLFTDSQRRELSNVASFPAGERIDAQMLSERLGQPPVPNSLVFVGHVAGGLIGGGNTSLRLTSVDDPSPGFPESAAAGWLSAADLVAGALGSGGVSGSELWPMPSRVAIVACNSGSDLGRREPFGLVVGCLNAGARWVVATRWVLPADVTLRDGNTMREGDPQPLTEVALSVVSAVAQDNPGEAIGDVLRERLRVWESLPVDAGVRARQSASPLTWGALAVFHAEERASQDVSSRLAHAKSTTTGVTH